MRSRYAAVSGFTLIEAMVAMVIFAVGAMASFAYFYQSQISLNLESSRRAATEVAQSRMEDLRTVEYANLGSYVETASAVDVDGINGSRKTEVQNVDDDGDGTADYARIIVTVSWPERNMTQTVVLTTLRSAYR